MKSIETHMDLVGRYLSGQASFEEVETLEALMREDSQLRADFLACARVDAALPAAVGEKRTLVEFNPPSDVKPKARRLFWASLAAAAALVMGMISTGGFGWWSESNSTLSEPLVVARFGELRDCRWVAPGSSIQSGDAIETGQRIELSSGSAEVLFDTGARLTVIGPAIIEPRTDNSAFLTMGEVKLVAETPQSKGFTLETPSSKFVDISTAFTAKVSPDGLSHLEVTEGEVDVVMEGAADTPRLKAGQALYVEPGKQQIITRIESGDGTPAFQFPTIDPPSSEDYADRAQRHASISVVQGELKRKPGSSGPPKVLLDGTGQSRQDAPDQSAFFRDGKAGNFLVDLGQPISITRINTYSWHQHYFDPTHRHRATQRYTLFGFSGDEAPELTKPLRKAGWQRIARVNSDRFFEVSEPLERPSQQACSITAARGEIGRYRYLLWVTKGPTFFGEFDVFGAP